MSDSDYDDMPPADSDADEAPAESKNNKKKKGKKKKKKKKGKHDDKEKAIPCCQKFRTELITGSVNAVIFFSAGAVFATGVLIGLMPRIRKTQQTGPLEILPKLSPMIFAAVCLTALFMVLTSIFGLCGVCCTKNAPNCSRCCICVNVVMGLIVTTLVTLIAVASVFFTVSTQLPGCPFGNFTASDLQPDITKCPYDSLIWMLMQPSSTVYSNWNSIQDVLGCCGYYCGYFVARSNSTSPLCMDHPATKWQRTGVKCAEKPMLTPTCREIIVQFFDEKMVYITLVSCFFALLLVLMIGTASVMRCSIQLDRDRPTLRLELPSVRKIIKKGPGGAAAHSPGSSGDSSDDSSGSGSGSSSGDDDDSSYD